MNTLCRFCAQSQPIEEDDVVNAVVFVKGGSNLASVGASGSGSGATSSGVVIIP